MYVEVYIMRKISDFLNQFLNLYEREQEGTRFANILLIKWNEPAHDKTYNKTYATSEDSD